MSNEEQEAAKQEWLEDALEEGERSGISEYTVDEIFERAKAKYYGKN